MTTPAKIGRYEIISEIGHGAMGVVYLAHDPRIDRRVAIKTIHALDVLPDLEAEEVRQRFTREAQAAGRLQHPGIVTIFDVGEHEGTWFIAMEYIEGETLERYARRDRLLPVPKVLELISQACEALDYAHQQRIVHRDIKPANLMLLKNGRLKITDFGLAKNPTTNLTQEGILIGTPNYMSPEQVMGRTLDGRSDLFSLAAVAYELLTGERPFPGDTVTTIIYRILNEQPPSPLIRNKQIPEPIAQVLAKALAKEPVQRFQTGAELAAALYGQHGQHEQDEELLADGIGATRPMRVVARPVPSRQSTDPITAPPPAAAPGSKAERRTRPVGPMGAAPRARPSPAPQPARGWRRARAGFIMLGTLALVFLIPAVGTIDDRWGRSDSDGRQPFYRTAGILLTAAGGGGAPPSGTSAASLAPPAPPAPPVPPAIALPGGPEAIAITWRTSPPGGRIYIDDVEAPDGVMHVSKKDAAAHTVVAENDCFIEKVSWRAGQDSDGATHSIALKTPKIATAPVSSKPPGAKVLLDGRDTGKITPADIPVPACGAHALSLRLDGYRDLEQKLEKPGEPVSLTLAKMPVGFVKISAPYAVSIFENGKQLGQSGTQIKLAGGAHRLVLKNEELFVERTINVTVQADKVLAPDAGLPGVGTLTVLASPSNCSISLNGRDLGPPPINDYRLAAGSYTIKAVYVPTGETKESSVTITAGGGTRVPFKFSQ